MELIQIILFMMVTSWYLPACILFSILFGVHLTIIFLEASEASPTVNFAQKTVVIRQSCQKCLTNIFVGLITLPFLGYSSDSTFRSTWLTFLFLFLFLSAGCRV